MKKILPVFFCVITFLMGYSQNYLELGKIGTSSHQRFALPVKTRFVLKNDPDKIEIYATLVKIEDNDLIFENQVYDTIFSVSWNDIRYIVPARTFPGNVLYYGLTGLFAYYAVAGTTVGVFFLAIPYNPYHLLGSVLLAGGLLSIVPTFYFYDLANKKYYSYQYRIIHSKEVPDILLANTYIPGSTYTHAKKIGFIKMENNKRTEYNLPLKVVLKFKDISQGKMKLFVNDVTDSTLVVSSYERGHAFVIRTTDIRSVKIIRKPWFQIPLKAAEVFSFYVAGVGVAVFLTKDRNIGGFIGASLLASLVYPVYTFVDRRFYTRDYRIIRE